MRTSSPGLSCNAAVVVAVMLLLGRVHAQGDLPAEPQTIQDMMRALIVSAPPPGSKDIASTAGSLRVGYALWDTGEERAGYNGIVGELAKETQVGPPDSDYVALDSIGSTTPLPTMQSSINNWLYLQQWARFSYPGDSIWSPAGNDFELAFWNPDITFFSSQNSVFSPETEPATNLLGMGSHTYDGLLDLADLAVPPSVLDLEFTHNIGFGNNLAFPAGQYDFNVEYPLITKHEVDNSLASLLGYNPTHNPELGRALQPQLFIRCWDSLVDDAPRGCLDPAVPFPILYHILSIVHPEVSGLVTQAIRAQILAFDTTLRQPAYHLVGGEYFIGTSALVNQYFFKVDDSAIPPCDSIDPTNYLPCLANTDYSIHSLRQFRQWLKAEKNYTLATLAQDWAWPELAVSPFQDCPSCSDTFIEDCCLINPLIAPSTADLQEITNAWNEFQAHQHTQSQVSQYNAAKAADREATYSADVLLLEFGPRGAEEGALLSDGSALGSWYKDNDTRQNILTPMKKVALHGVTYGESLHFPIFAMPRVLPEDLDNLTPADFCAVDESMLTGVPFTFWPACFDAAFSYRTLREFLALGVDTLGLAYWENAALLTIANSSPLAATLPQGSVAFGTNQFLSPLFATIHGGFFGDGPPGNIAEVLGGEVAKWRQITALMTPWRSPVLVHTGSAAGKFGPGGTTAGPYATGLASRVLDELARDHLQFAPFADPRGLDDQWVVSGREILLSPLLPELMGPNPNITLLDDYITAVFDHWQSGLAQMTLVVLTDRDGFLAIQAAKGGPVISLGGGVYAITVTRGGPTPTPVGFVVGTINSAVQDVLIESLLADGLDLITAGSVRPVRAVPTTIAECPGAASSVLDMDVTVMSGGMDLLVSVANTYTSSQSFTLEFDPKLVAKYGLGDPPYTIKDVDGSVITSVCDLGDLDQVPGGTLDSVLLHCVANPLPPPSGAADAESSVDVLAAAVDWAHGLLAEPAPTNNADVAWALLEQLRAIAASSFPGEDGETHKRNKLIAGLVRLDRLPLLDYDASSQILSVTELDLFAPLGPRVSPVSGARLQIEFPLQQHVRNGRSVSETDDGGSLFLSREDLQPPPDGWVLDFTSERGAYRHPDWDGGDLHLVKLEVQHPKFLSQSSITIDLTMVR